MGNSASKAAGKASAAAGRRQYPSTSSILNNATSTSNAPGSTTNAPQQHTKPFAPSQVHPDPTQSPATENKNQQIDLDGRDPQFGASLRKLGPAIAVPRPAPGSSSSSPSAFPTSSQPPAAQQNQNIFPPTSRTSNPSVLVTRARERIAQQFESQSENLGRGSFAGRTLLAAKDVSEALRLRDEKGMDSASVEKRMRLKPGVLDQLGPRGMIGNAGV